MDACTMGALWSICICGVVRKECSAKRDLEVHHVDATWGIHLVGLRGYHPCECMNVVAMECSIGHSDEALQPTTLQKAQPVNHI